MVEAEFLAFEMLTLLSSYFGTAHLAAQSVLVTATSITFQLGFALSIASSTRVANFLGATLEDAARTAAHTGFIAAGFIGLFNFCLMTSISSRFVLLFTDDPEIIGYVVQVMPLTALFQCVDAISTMGSGVLRGQGMNTPYPFSFSSFFYSWANCGWAGRQHIGSYINIVAYYVIAMPFSATAAFVFGWELLGLWSGIALALLFVAILETMIVLKTDWAKVVADAKARISNA